MKQKDGMKKPFIFLNNVHLQVVSSFTKKIVKRLLQLSGPGLTQNMVLAVPHLTASGCF